MLPYFMGLTTLGSVRPYIRKHVYATLEPIDFMFVNALLIALFMVVYFGYICLFHDEIIQRTYTNCCRLSGTQIAGLLLLAFFTVVSSLMFFNLEKNFNTPAINNVTLKALSMIALFLVGYIVFEESYHSGHLLGIVLTVAGLVVLMFNPIQG